MIKTQLFIGSKMKPLSPIREYGEFVKENQSIDIISVNIFSHNYILLTYRA